MDGTRGDRGKRSTPPDTERPARARRGEKSRPGEPQPAAARVATAVPNDPSSAPIRRKRALPSGTSASVLVPVAPPPGSDGEGDGVAAAPRPRRLPTRATETPPQAPREDEEARWEARRHRNTDLKRTLRSGRTTGPAEAAEPPAPARRDPVAPTIRAPKPSATPQPPPPEDDSAGTELIRQSPSPRQPAAKPQDAAPQREALDPGAAADEAAIEPRRKASLIDAPATDAIVENGPIVAPDTVVRRGFIVVVAIMTLLSALLVGAGVLVENAAGAWGKTVLDDISVTVLPLDGDPLESRLDEVAAALSAAPGLEAVEIVSAAQAGALLEPWLGTGTDLSLLPIPRLVIAKRSPATAFDKDALADRLTAIPGVSLDDHTSWSETLSHMATAITTGALATVALMLVATTIAVVFATRSTISQNRSTVEVLHVLGADRRFVQRAFRARFTGIGLRGVGLGLFVALVLFGGLEAWSTFSPAATSAQSEALLGAPRIGIVGFAALFAVAFLIAVFVTITTGLAVRSTIRELER